MQTLKETFSRRVLKLTRACLCRFCRNRRRPSQAGRFAQRGAAAGHQRLSVRCGGAQLGGACSVPADTWIDVESV